MTGTRGMSSEVELRRLRSQDSGELLVANRMVSRAPTLAAQKRVDATARIRSPSFFFFDENSREDLERWFHGVI